MRFWEQHKNRQFDLPGRLRGATGRIDAVCCWSTLGLIVWTAAGCGGGESHLSRQAISGKVTLDDEPLLTGTIAFSPQGAKRSAPIGGGMIRGGHYDLPAAKGLPVGEYIVRISSSGAGRASGPPMTAENPLGALREKAGEEIIPVKYNSATTLTAKVAAGAANKFDFDLKSR